MIRQNINEFNTNIFEEFPKEALLTAGDFESRNTMTVSWGMMGTIWGKPMVIVFVRPTRFTFPQMEKSDYFSLSFMPKKYQDKLTYMGTHSGRNENKYESTGLIPVYDNDSFVSYIKDADYVLKCKIVYKDYIKPECFKDLSLLKHYNKELNDYHMFYIAELTSLLVRENEA